MSVNCSGFLPATVLVEPEKIFARKWKPSYTGIRCTTPIYHKVRPPLTHTLYNYLLGLGTEKWSECAFPKSTINHFLASSDNCEKRSMDFFYLLKIDHEREERNV